jgi:hypothetical protein
MITSKAIFSTLMMVLLLTGSARAGELFTPPLLVTTSNTTVDCALLNVSGVDGSVRIRIVNAAGDTVSDSGFHTVALGDVTDLGHTSVAGAHYCHFTVFPTSYLGVTNPFRTTITLSGLGGPVAALSGDTVCGPGPGC